MLRDNAVNGRFQHEYLPYKKDYPFLQHLYCVLKLVEIFVDAIDIGTRVTRICV